MTGTMRATILGCGSSGGVPRVGGDWGVCDPGEPRNRRTRGSLLLQRWRGAAGEGEATTVVIDTSPDLREQFLAHGVTRLDAILFSHDHADQTHGIDDVRALAQQMRKRIPTYMDPVTWATMTRRFDYIFRGSGGYPAILSSAETIVDGVPLHLDGPGGPLVVTPLLQEHGAIASFGFRIAGFAYNNDVSELPEHTMAALEGLDVWVVDALRYAPHPSHAHLERTLGWIDRLRPKRAVLTNLHVDLDYATLVRTLPHGVEPAHDGWSVDLPYIV
ncbi:MAG: MBL fold metallo-hydrolase [Hyphomonadaceae bacterium]|nr:MBL fold metallo-hydrolase [Hyphomonadaceae bacterium]